jgi:uncharacterized RDD family membrane protein YckC
VDVRAASPLQEPHKAERGTQPTPPALEAAVANRFKRLAAGAIDVALVESLIVYAWLVLPRRVLTSGGTGRTRVLLILLPLAAAAYAVMRDSIEGKSLGKLLFGLTAVSTVTGQPVGLRQSLVRNAAFSVALAPLVVGAAAFAVVAGFIGVQILLGHVMRAGDVLALTTVVEDRKWGRI